MTHDSSTASGSDDPGNPDAREGTGDPGDGRLLGVAGGWSPVDPGAAGTPGPSGADPLTTGGVAPHQSPYFPPQPGTVVPPPVPASPAPPPGVVQVPPGYPPYGFSPPAQSGAAKPKRWGIPSALVGLALFSGGQLVFGVTAFIVWLATGHTGAPPAIPLALAGLLPAYAAVLGWLFVVSRWRGEGIRADYVLRFKWYDIFLGLGGGLVAMGAVLGGTLLVAALTGADPESNVGTTVLENAGPGLALYVFLVVVAFVGPFVEELLYRGLVWRALSNRMGPVLTLLISSAVFGAVHLEPVRMLGLLAGGVALGGLRLLTNRMAAPLIAHMLLNMISAGSLFYEIVLR